MSIAKELFGRMPDGEEVYAYTLQNEEGVRVKIITYGGAIVELYVPDRTGSFRDVVGGYDSLESYLYGDGYQGALIGRFGNRIAEGKFTLEGREYTLYRNDGNNHLHGGESGFNAKLWKATALDGVEPTLILRLISPDGEEGYPGTLDLTVTYCLTKENGLSIRYVATTDQTTVVNLTNHTYFNLKGYNAKKNIHSLRLWLDADTYVPTDRALIPTGEIRSVKGTPFDFRKEKEIGRDIADDAEDIRLAGGYDHCLNFTGGETKEPVKRGELYDPTSGRVMELYTNQPCVQLYSGNFLKNEKFPFKGGTKQVPQMLLCLETQKMPDSVHRDNFTSCVLKAGEVYDYTTEYRFSVR